MSKTFGARKKDTGEAIYDAYPLVRLTELLCFENLDEAKSACKHYNITVKQMKVSSSQSPRNEIAEVVFWRQSDFKIPKHPEKGFELPLQPWKMLRTIEKKLNGATRLAVCRGEVSGEGAALMKPFLAATQTSTAGAVLDARAQTEQRAKAAALLMKQKFEQARLEKEAKKNEQKERESNEARRREEVARRGQEERHLKEERRKREEEAKELAELENQRLEKIREMELRMQREKAIREQEKRKQEDMEERKRLEIEAENARKAEEELRLKEAEARRVQLEQEKARQMKEQAERERKEEEERRLKEYQQRLAEEARQKKIEEERRLKEAEARRLELLRQQIEEQRRKEAEERRKAKEWRDRIDSARKIILWCRWRRRFSRRLEMTQGSKASLQHIDPTFTRDSFHIGESIWNAFNESANQNKENFPTNPENARRIIETLLRNNHAQLCLSSMAAEEIKSSPALYRSLAGEDGSNDSPKSVLLFKVAVFIPFSSHSEDGLIGELVRLWIKNRLDFERITSNKWTNGKRIEYEIRSVVVCGIESKVCSNCDVALFVLPPPWGNPHSRVNELRSLSSMIDESVPRVALVLGEAVDEALFDSLNELLALHIGGGSGRLPIIYTSNMSVDAYENALESACRKVAKLFVHEACVKVNRLPVIRLASMAVINSLWRNVPLARQSNEEYILECSKSALLAVIEEINTHLRQNEQVWSTWPPVEFSSNHGVESYFSEDGNLPSEWVKSLRQENIQEAISRLLQDFDGSLRDVVQRFLSGAPRCVRDECFAMFAKRQYRRCLEKSLMWAQASGVDTVAEGPMLYIPDSFMELVVQGVADRTKPKDENHQDFSSGLDWYTNNGGPTKSAEEFPEKPMLPPPGKLLEAVSNKRRRAGVTGPNYYGQVPEASAEFGFRDKRRRDEPASLVSEDLQLSAQFSKKLEEMMHGNRTVDLPVGESSLTRLMRGVPSLDLETM